MSDIIKQAYVYVVRKPMPDKDDMYTSSTHPLTITQTREGENKRVRFEQKWCGAWIGNDTGKLVLRFRGDGKPDADKYLHLFQPLPDGNYQLLKATHPAYDEFPKMLRHNNKYLVLLVRIPTVEYVYEPEEPQLVPEEFEKSPPGA